MTKSWNDAFGDPETFLKNISSLANNFKRLANVEHFGLDQIRGFVESRNFQLTNDPEALRSVVAAFSTLLLQITGVELRLRGFFRKTVVVRSCGFNGELLDVFYRCVFEGVDLDALI